MRRFLNKLPFFHHQPPFSLPYRSIVIMATKRPVKIEQMVEKILIYSSDDIHENIAQLNTSINYLRNKRLQRRDASNLSVAAVRAICEMDKEIGIEFGMSIFEKYPDERGLRTLISHLWSLHRAEEALELLKKLGSSEWKRQKLEKLVHWISRVNLTEQGNRSNSKDFELQSKIDSLGEDEVVNTLKNSDELTYGDFKNLTAACILDEFSYNSFKFEANFVQLSVDAYIEELESCKPDMLFVESAWRGKDERWGSKVGHASKELVEILEWCKVSSVPTIFWNKEDPVHYNSFLNVAKLFEYVFTTDMDCIHRYKTALNHDRVYFLPFAFQPKLSNPVEKYQRKPGVCFAGAYYHKYPERCSDMNELLSAISDFGYLEIYDRNYGLDVEEFKFPEEFQEFIIGTLPFEKIDLAYKGYDYGLNLNSIKQSQSMFARRVFELLASNTLVVSNYSRGVRLLFGDHVICSDNKSEVLKNLIDNDEKSSQKKLSALRTVFSNHTYGERFRYVLSKISSNVVETILPEVSVVCKIKSEQELFDVEAIFTYQNYKQKKLILIGDAKILKSSKSEDVIKVKNTDEIKSLNELEIKSDYVSIIKVDKFYGRNYITDLALSTLYSDAEIITKASFYDISEGILTVENKESTYSLVQEFEAHRSLTSSSLVLNQPIVDLIEKPLSNQLILSSDIFSIDEFNFCESSGLSDEQILVVENLPTFYEGEEFKKLVSISEDTVKDEYSKQGEFYSSIKFYEEICDLNNKDVLVDYVDGKTRLVSKLEDGKHTYLYWPKLIEPSELGFVDGVGNFYFDTSPGLRLMLALVFTDSNGKKIDSKLALSNSNMTVELPSEHCMIKLGIRVYSGGSADINMLEMAHRDLSPQKVVGQSDVLILTNHYPSYDDIYRNGFIHSRVREYTKNGICPDIFKLREGENINFSEFEGVDIISGSIEALRRLIETQTYQKILVHFLDKSMWDVIEPYSQTTEILVWVHGSEIQPWHRRTFNYSNDSELNKAKIESKKRMEFWIPLLQNLPAKMKLIFVSEYFAKEVMEDTGTELTEEQYLIIHNPIDTNLFKFVEKKASQRMKVLSIRPYASRKYANDLTVNSILELSKSKEFKEMEFLMVGAGKLFESTLEPLRDFDNVKIHEGFLTHSEISELHKQFGIFMTPTRMDSQGVSRDEAMSSGLVPITNAVTAIPEFVDSECGILTAGEDYKGMAEGVLQLVRDEERFLQMSNSAAKRVRNQSSTKIVIRKEIDLIKSRGEDS